MAANTKSHIAEFIWSAASVGPATITNRGMYPIEVIVDETSPNQNLNGNIVHSKGTFSYGGESSTWVRTQKNGIRVSLIVSEED